MKNSTVNMPSFKQKSIINNCKSRMQDKLRDVIKESDSITAYLSSNLLQFEAKVLKLTKIDEEKFFTEYQSLNQDLENYREKLFLVQTTLELFTESSDGSSAPDISVQEDLHVQNSSHMTDEKVLREKVEIANEANNDVCKYSADFSDILVNTNPVQDNASIHSGNTNLFNCNLKEFEISSSGTENYFYKSQNKAHSVNTETTAIQNESFCSDKIGSEKSISHSSYYHSVSSNLSDACSDKVLNSFKNSKDKILKSYNDGKDQKEFNLLDSTNVSSGSKCSIPGPSVIVPSEFLGTLTYIEDPGSFWIEIENSQACNPRFPLSEYLNRVSLKQIKNGSFCLARFQSSPYYCRAKALTDANSDREEVKVFFIDIGGTEFIPLCDLRPLPWAEYDIPAKAIHCYLFGILPYGNNWSVDCVQKFQEYEYHNVETTVICNSGDRYGVKLISKQVDDFSIDIAYLLICDGLAVENEIERGLGDVKENVSSTVSFDSCKAYVKDGEISNNKTSCDSGVSVASTCRSNNNCQESLVNINDFSDSGAFHFVPLSTLNNKIAISDEKRSENVCENKLDVGCDLISFESFEEVQSSKSKQLKYLQGCDTTISSDFEDTYSIYLTVPSPKMQFVEKNMMLVMLSHIISPDEFYVNMAMENSLNLDELREQMTAAYESVPETVNSVNICDLKEGMFCAARYDQDENWYRVRILQFISDVRDRGEVLVHYIDYGNKAKIKSNCLYPLTTQFAECPVFAVKCSLAGVTPVKEAWDECAVCRFKELTSFERCLTAQICEDICKSNSDVLQILLWDTEGSEDRLINCALAQSGVASFDQSILNKNLPIRKTDQLPNEVEILNQWDPMSEEFYSIENSYGVDVDDIDVAITGYKAKDGSYVCKYFSLRGRCPRGVNCPYEHVQLAESGVTRDQEEVYSFNCMPFIPDTSSNIIVEVSASSSPGHFYVILPFGIKTVDEVDSLIRNGSTYDKIVKKLPTKRMSKYYSSVPFDENTTVALACGTIVAAEFQGEWYRGRVVDIKGIAEPAEIFFVDLGIKKWVPRRSIRKIVEDFLCDPFQAIECSLTNVEPVGFGRGQSWSSEAVNFFNSLVSGEILLAEVNDRYGDKLHLSLRKTRNQNHDSIADLLVTNGYAQYCTSVKSQAKQDIYVPG